MSCSRSTISRASCSARATSRGPTATTWRPPRRCSPWPAAAPGGRHPRATAAASGGGRRRAPVAEAHMTETPADVRQVPGLPIVHRALAGGRARAPRRAAPRRDRATDPRARVPPLFTPILFDPVFRARASGRGRGHLPGAARERDREGARGARGRGAATPSGTADAAAQAAAPRPPTCRRAAKKSATVAKDCRPSTSTRRR